MKSIYSRVKNEWEEGYWIYEGISIVAFTTFGGVPLFEVLFNDHRIFQTVQVLNILIVCSVVAPIILAVQKPRIVFRTFVTLLIVNMVELIIFNFQL